MILELLSVLVMPQNQPPEIMVDDHVRLQSSYGWVSNNQLNLQAPQPGIVGSSVNYAALLGGTYGGIQLDVESNTQMGGTAMFSLGLEFHSNFGQPISEMVDAVFRVEFASMQPVNTLHIITSNSNPQIGVGAYEIDFDGDGIFDWSSNSPEEPKKEHQFFGTSYNVLVKVHFSTVVSMQASKLDTLSLRNIPGGTPIAPVRVGVDPYLLDWQRGLSDTTFFVSETVVPVVLVVGNTYFPAPVYLGPMPIGSSRLNAAYVQEEFHYLYNWPQPGLPNGQSSFDIPNWLLNQLPPLKIQAFVYYPNAFIAGNVLEVND